MAAKEARKLLMAFEKAVKQLLSDYDEQFSLRPRLGSSLGRSEARRGRSEPGAALGALRGATGGAAGGE